MSAALQDRRTQRAPGLRAWVLLPLLLFLGLVVFLALGLQRNPQEIPSPLVGQTAPVFSLPMGGADRVFSSQQFQGRVSLVNFWATWCAGCRQEHPLLLALARQSGVQMVGLNYKELQATELAGHSALQPDAVRQATQRQQDWLQKHGQAFHVSLMDLDGRVGMDWGVYGLPETYVVDREGVVRFKHAGALTPEIVQQQLLPLLQRLQP